jgi:hypothetical protein
MSNQDSEKTVISCREIEQNLKDKNWIMLKIIIRIQLDLANSKS